MPLIGTTIFSYSKAGLWRADERRPYNLCKIRKSLDFSNFLQAVVVTPWADGSFHDSLNNFSGNLYHQVESFLPFSINREIPMPTYVYETLPKRKGDPVERFEIWQSMKEDPLKTHP